jgi:hypothetical protein
VLAKESIFIGGRQCSPDGAKRNPGKPHGLLRRTRIALRSIRATILSERRIEKILDFQLEILRIERGISEATTKRTYEDQKNTISDILKTAMASRGDKPI